MRGHLLVGLAATACVACTHPTVVQRAYGGDVLAGRYVAPEAYGAFLRGALAEASHKPEEAVQAYAEAARLDTRSPEPWTRIARVRCSSGAGGVAAGTAAATRALAIDPEYAPAWEAKAECDGVLGNVAMERSDAAHATQLDPHGDGANVLLAQSHEEAATAASRDALIALTATAYDPVTAWAALATWAEAHGDPALSTRALVALVRMAPERREAIARTAEEWAGAGALGEARTVAGAAVDADERPLPAKLSLAARLAVDEAIVRGDSEAVRRRATRGRIALEEVAARALLAGKRVLAREIASTVAAADQAESGAQLLLAVTDGADLVHAAARPSTDVPASGAAYVAFGTALFQRVDVPSARSALATIPHAPLEAGDALVVRPAVELASRGVLAPAALPLDGRLELAVIEGKAPAEASFDALDLGHRYLALALTQPKAPATSALARRLRTAVSDPVVIAADALVQLATGQSIPPGASRAILAHNPADPLLAAVALRVAEKVGDVDVARRARETLTAVGSVKPAVN